MADEKSEEQAPFEGEMAPSSLNETVEAPPLNDAPKPAPKTSNVVFVDEQGCTDVDPPQDPTFKGARY